MSMREPRGQPLTEAQLAVMTPDEKMQAATDGWVKSATDPEAFESWYGFDPRDDAKLSAKLAECRERGILDQRDAILAWMEAAAEAAKPRPVAAFAKPNGEVTIRYRWPRVAA